MVGKGVAGVAGVQELQNVAENSRLQFIMLTARNHSFEAGF
jgi:hypothetical protein